MADTKETTQEEPAAAPPAQPAAPGSYSAKWLAKETAAELEAQDRGKPPAPPPQPPPRGSLAVIVILVAAALGCAFYVCTHLLPNAGAEHPNEGALRLQLSTLVCFLGMAFAVLGFGLFVLGAGGSLSARMDKSSKAPAWSLDTAAPGLVVTVCATVLIYFALDLARPPAVAKAEPAAPAAGSAGRDAGIQTGADAAAADGP